MTVASAKTSSGRWPAKQGSPSHKNMATGQAVQRGTAPELSGGSAPTAKRYAFESGTVASSAFVRTSAVALGPQAPAPGGTLKGSLTSQRGLYCAAL